jgi:predicted alpha/beta-hydrolase family hydrolase
MEWKAPVDDAGEVSATWYEAAAAPACLVLAHGAGAGHKSTFMTSFAGALAGLGVDVVTFNFLYTERRRRLPDRRPLLESCYRSVVSAVRHKVPSARKRLFIGGKSMGGRIATHIAASDSRLPVEGIVLLGYPLHPPGKPQERRDAHLPQVGRRMLFVQGSRDAFGTPAELKPVLDSLSPPPTLHVVEGGDHSFKVARFGAEAQAAIYDDVQRTIVEWIAARQ